MQPSTDIQLEGTHSTQPARPPHHDLKKGHAVADELHAQRGGAHYEGGYGHAQRAPRPERPALDSAQSGRAGTKQGQARTATAVRACQHRKGAHLAQSAQSLTAQHCAHHAPAALVESGTPAPAFGLGFPPPTSPERPASKAVPSPPSERLPAALAPCAALGGALLCVSSSTLEGCAARKLKLPLSAASCEARGSRMLSWLMKLPELWADRSADVKPTAPLDLGSSPSCSPSLAALCGSTAPEYPGTPSSMANRNADCTGGPRITVLRAASLPAEQPIPTCLKNPQSSIAATARD